MALMLDHLVVTAPSLAAGVAAVEASLGVALSPGGQHALMGTHNALLRLGPRLYLEVIAVDPQAPAPARSRWFGLDRPPTPPRLAHWLAASDDIVRDAPAFGFAPDEILAMTRGDFRWRITVPRDGSLPGGGAAPSLIQWDGAHPAARLADAGCALARLAIRLAASEALANTLKLCDLNDERLSITSGSLQLSADIITPTGRRAVLGDTARD